MFFVLFFSFLLFTIINTQLWAASIDGLRPTWQPAIIYTGWAKNWTIER